MLCRAVPCRAILPPCHPRRAILTVPSSPCHPAKPVAAASHSAARSHLPRYVPWVPSRTPPQQPPSCMGARGRSSRFGRQGHHQLPKKPRVAQKGHPWDARSSLARRLILNMSHRSITPVRPKGRTSRHPVLPQTLGKRGPRDDAKRPVWPLPSPRRG